MTASSDTDPAFAARLQQCVADGVASVMAAPHAVNEAMIAMWADALIDRNPIYVDEAAARASGRSGIIAPPQMIQAWVMPKLSHVAQGCKDVAGYAPWHRYPSDPYALAAEGSADAYKLLAEGGYSNSLATNCRQYYHYEVRPGDRLRCLSTVDSISALKRTAAGTGHFLTTRLEYYDQDDRHVATQLWTVLRFRSPSEKDSATTSGQGGTASPLPPLDLSGGPLRSRPEIGQLTEPMIIPITPSFVVATALATHDFYLIHHDTDWTRSLGQPDIFVNILTTTGLVGGVMTRWGGPAVRLRSTDLKLFVPNYPGDELTLVGKVTAVDGDEVTMAVSGRNRLGAHVEAVVVGSVPAQ